MSFARVMFMATGVSLLTACNLLPSYRKPPVEMPVTWKLEGPWRVATPSDGIPKGPWWKRFGDPQLDALVEKALSGSPTLSAANARLAQARALATAASAGLYPQLNLSSRITNERIS